MKLQTPTAWSGVTIQQWMALRDLADEYKEDGNTLTYQIRQLAIMADIREDQAREVPLSEYNNLRRRFLFLQVPPDGKAPGKFTIKSNTYRPRLDFDSMTASEFIDLTEYSKSPEDNAHELLALMCDGPGKAHERAEVFLQCLTMDKAYPLLVFFYTVWSDFTSNTLLSLTEAMSQRLTSEWSETPPDSDTTPSIGGGS